MKCEEYYRYVIRTFERTGANVIEIHGTMPDRCIKYFEYRGIKVEKGMYGYIRFIR